MGLATCCHATIHNCHWQPPPVHAERCDALAGQLPPADVRYAGANTLCSLMICYILHPAMHGHLSQLRKQSYRGVVLRELSRRPSRQAYPPKVTQFIW
jgi:hypothetical protein